MIGNYLVAMIGMMIGAACIGTGTAMMGITVFGFRHRRPEERAYGAGICALGVLVLSLNVNWIIT